MPTGSMDWACKRAVRDTDTKRETAGKAVSLCVLRKRLRQLER